MTIKGNVVSVLDLQNGTSKAGKEWKKQEFVIETFGKYPKKVLISLFGDKIDSFGSLLTIGQFVECEIDISSREWTSPTTGKVSWFTEVSAFSVIADQTNTVTQQQPFANPQPAPQPPASQQPISETGDEETDDLPF